MGDLRPQSHYPHRNAVRNGCYLKSVFEQWLWCSLPWRLRVPGLHTEETCDHSHLHFIESLWRGEPSSDVKGESEHSQQKSIRTRQHPGQLIEGRSEEPTVWNERLFQAEGSQKQKLLWTGEWVVSSLRGWWGLWGRWLVRVHSWENCTHN